MPEETREATEPQAKPAPPPPTSAQAEVRALGKAYEALQPLDTAARHRAIRWLGDRFDADERRAQRDAGDPWSEEPPF